MVLTPGLKLGPYVIHSPLGAGGMGEVYRARDTRLDRDVALKVLRSEIAVDPDRRARFEREAKTVAALSHPNIVALHEVGNADGLEYTVSELVEGESLRVKMQHGAMPVRQVVELATQFADGMATAHAAGIVHRDLKPENVMVTRDGRVKILDFGLARVLRTTHVSGSVNYATTEAIDYEAPAASPATAEYHTIPGMILGTVAYMSPEQARRQEASYRSDQFSFGLIVYEMLGGKQAFVRDSAVETMAAIVHDEPEPLHGRIPVPLKWLVDRCLEKDPTRRFDSSRDLYQQLRTMRDHFSEAYLSGVQAGSPEGAEDAQTGTKRQALSVVAAVVLTALLAATMAGAGGWWLHPAGVQLSKYEYTPFEVNADSALWSPDGKMVAYAGNVGENNTELFLRTLDSPIPRQLTHSPGNVSPLGWLPDSSRILYRQAWVTDDPDQVLSVSTVGGEPDVLWTLSNLALVAVSPDGKAGVAYCSVKGEPSDLYISDPIGSPLRRYPDSHVTAHVTFNTPQIGFSPNGKQLLLIRAGDSGVEESWLLPWPAGSGTPRQVLRKLPHEGGTPNFAWMPDNRHIIAATANGISTTWHLYLADIESDRLQQITQGTSVEESPAVSPDGTSLQFTQNTTDFDIVSMSLADGTTHGLIVTPRSESMPAWAARSDSLVYVSDRLGPEDIWLHTKDSPDRPLVTRASFAQDQPKWIYAPVLSPDGTRVIFVVVEKTGEQWLYEASVAGGAPVRLIDASDTSKAQFTGDWSPDGRQFAFRSIEPDGKSSLKVVRTSGGAVAKKLFEGMAYVVPSWSPDGKWIAYSDFNNKWHLISPDGKQNRDLGKISTTNLGFSKDGRTAYGIHFDNSKSILFSLDIETAKLRDIKVLDNSLQPSSPLDPAIRYTLAPDGKSFAYATFKWSTSLWMLQGFDGK
jgi:Tol biopolymer transport system component/tRNA A-37 threonylcarbamoyl transferase component Bud32